MTRCLVAAIALLALIALPVQADAPIPTFEKITVGASAVSIGSSTLRPTVGDVRRYCLMTLETADIRWRADGTDPDSGTGHLFQANGKLTLVSIYTLSRFRAIRSGGSNGTLSVSCW